MGNEVIAVVTPKKNLKISLSDGTTMSLTIPQSTAEDSRKALFDLALVETGLQTPCFVPLGDSNAIEVGKHLISIGFPGAATSAVLYEGFLSARAARLPLPFGTIEGRPNLSYTPHYEILRVQMPITPGTSGSPVISDSNRVVGVISEVPVILTNDVQNISEVYGGLGGASSGVLLSGFDVTKIVGELAWTVSQFESPGAGLAVPVSNLNEPIPASDPTKPKASPHPQRQTSSPKSQ